MAAEAEAQAAAVLEQLQRVGAKVFFEKQLTSSDVSASGRVVVPKAVAEQYFPKLDSPTGMSLQVEDAHGGTYTLRWRFWINNQSRMYLLEGTADLQQHYHLKMGDVLIFAQKGDRDKTVVLAGRPATRADAMRRAAAAARKPSPAPAGNGSGKGGGKGGKDAVKERNRRAAMRRHGVNPEDVEPPADGVFRAIPSDTMADTPHAVSQVRAGRWLASLNLAGELYQAFFPSEDQAAEAIVLAGFTQPAVSV
ncbi:MAG: DNA-binding pseudobarrel-protein domain-containing protein-containing protein [Monoraphidium minutum]|nr:MAG: DNA-binding pseudobarrel-protein domain-containing protein-containing protein [Monoraphidium minutum]